MKRQKATVVFDIGKTNKKCFVFDKQYQILEQSYTEFEEITDEDGYPTENLEAVANWVMIILSETLHNPHYQVEAVNFSTYGASMVHIDAQGKPLTPLYNYTKPMPPEVLDKFHDTYGQGIDIATETASPEAGMLNTGLQLYWLQQAQPHVFNKIRYSLHFPQYLVYRLTGVPLGEYTTLGCHTSLWNYQQGSYHAWVSKAGFNNVLPPLVDTRMSINTVLYGKHVRVGVGIHDSSAALIPYVLGEPKPFLLLSTGTWCVALNPFYTRPFTPQDIDSNSLCYMGIDGKPVMATRFFMGKEYNTQVRILAKYFDKPNDYHKTVKFDPTLCQSLEGSPRNYFRFAHLLVSRNQPEKTVLDGFENFEEAYHQLLGELLAMQFKGIEQTIGEGPLNKIFIDGGFVDNDVFTKMVALRFQQYKVRTTQSPLGSALGAAMVLDHKPIGKRFFKTAYQMKKLKPK